MEQSEIVPGGCCVCLLKRKVSVVYTCKLHLLRPLLSNSCKKYRTLTCVISSCLKGVLAILLSSAIILL